MIKGIPQPRIIRSSPVWKDVKPGWLIGDPPYDDWQPFAQKQMDNTWLVRWAYRLRLKSTFQMGYIIKHPYYYEDPNLTDQHFRDLGFRLINRFYEEY